MSNTPKAPAALVRSKDPLDVAERGMYSSAQSLSPSPFVYTSTFGQTPVDSPLSPASPVHQGITPCTSVPELQLPAPAKGQVERVEVVEEKPKKPAPFKPKISRRILIELWFNAYRRFFTVIVVLNAVGIILAASGRFQYAENHLGTLVLSNLLGAILMRNELFVRSLYTVAIYGLRGVSQVGVPEERWLTFPEQWAPLCIKLAVTSVLQHLGGIHSGCALSGAA